ncbi:ComEC/Rec2 family competence protein [Campylobacter upsaliensis]|nr:ComEC/Rec2 family competence protein [Campylobacter upsaliensis]EAI9053986.1 ComEC/Rec2 family competence protein [Campylobacter upsaliensis]EAI9059007.1 ComEC/Rec2 family competence protein [Campylobacter upsaliensis]EAJ2423815.1 ComEC/Rec2 family competence protein [Campylobacter upsaliensis]EAJ7110417.1 ComEC/Rec2 family competence protein [Campylobacter upsaliensis]
MLLRNSFLKPVKEFLFLILACGLIFLFNVTLEYQKFLNFKEQKHFFIKEARLENIQEKLRKNGKKYFVLKLKTKEFSFYTTTYKDLNLSKNELLSLRIINENLSFKDYLAKSFYAPSYDFKILAKREENAIITYFLKQHESEKMKEFYGALFFAKSVSKELRNDVNHYGIAHLIAISGYHIGLLFSLIFFFLAPLYGFFQRRYFPYRNLKFDLSIFIFIVLFAYAYLIGFVPSFTRSLVMALFGFYLLIKNIKILSFFNLFLCVLICLSLYPNLLFSVGFFFSILGVFYIFLYLHHFAKFFGIVTNLILINLWTFLAMIIPVLYFFPLISYQQFLAIFLSLIFVLFYPLALLLHLVGAGFLLDHFLLEFFAFKFHSTNFILPFWAFCSYLLLSLFGIYFRILAFFCILLNLIPFIFI